MTKKLVLDGASLTLEALALAARDPEIPIECQPKALARVAAGWKRTVAFVEAYTKDPNDPAKRVYGVTTGFGEFKDRYVPPEKLVELQRNLLKSHAVGVGETVDPNDPRNDYPLEVVRAVILLRLNTFLRGHSG